MTDSLLTSYEEVPYDSGPIPSSHPDTLATIATLYGMSPPPVARSRVLELGCSTGGNLLGMALCLPESSFVGIDLAPRQIAEARHLADTLRLRNVELMAMSIADIDEGLGTFDYIICHGVYSWVPPNVQEAILRVCAKNLAPNGVAYVSYNTYPGWHARAMVRDMILFHDDAARPPLERVARGRALVEFLARSVTSTKSVYKAALEEELVTLRSMTDSHFLHEELESVNDPVYFAEFARRAAVSGLQYLAEATFAAPATALPPAIRDPLLEWSADVVQLEQYVDFLRERTFRRTLLCHAGVELRPEPGAEAVAGLHIAGHAVPIPPVADPASDTAEEFRSPDGATVKTNHPLIRAALHILYEMRPNATSFPELWRRVRERTAGAAAFKPDDDQAARAGWLAGALLQCAAGQLVELHVEPPRCYSSLSDRPMASALARTQAAAGRRATNLRHYPVELIGFDRVVLAHLDGTRDRTALLSVVRSAVDLGEITLQDREHPTSDELDAALDASLHRLAATALLVS